uniref:TF-B3 domain-containing protein n=1 Tax=Tanacetum cinerariifolium TaxID=118510 RepID=A0A6L2K6T2_TANCI|nr:hypothetical protein [Tanacetum cinerariifolium]
MSSRKSYETMSLQGNLQEVFVIPKRYAKAYFPQVPEGKGVELLFHDADKTLWTFKYCQRKCSTNFVFAKGWKHFVKQTKLMPKHKISSYANEDSGVFEIETGLPAASNAKAFMLFGVAIIP